MNLAIATTKQCSAMEQTVFSERSSVFLLKTSGRRYSILHVSLLS
jgi:hypothetical protein